MTGRVHVEAVLSFNTVRKGDKSWVELTPELDNHIHAGYLKVLEVEPEDDQDGKIEPGPGGYPEGSEGRSDE